MKNPKTPADTKNRDRRSGFNRRWIKSGYRGQDRRAVKDRREGLPVRDLLVADDLDTNKMLGFEKLLVSTTIQLEAITRLLLHKGIVKEEELREMMKRIQSEYYGDIEI